MNSRAPGMKMYDIPIVVWMIVIASILFMASVGPLIAGAIMLLFDQNDRHRLLRPRRAAATRSSGSTCSGSSATPRSTWCCCRRSASSPRSSRSSRARSCSRYKTVLYTTFAHRRAELLRVGAPPVHRRHRPAHGERLHDHDAADLGADRRDDVRLHRHAVRRLDPLTTPMLWALVVHRRVPDRRRDRHLPRRERRGHLLPRHLLRARPLPLHVLPDRDHRHVRGRHVLVPEDVRPDDERDARQDSLLGHDHPVQLHLHPAVHARRWPATTAASTTTRTSPS